MRYFWVNQNQTGQHEVLGGFLWSPKRKNNGGRHQFYEYMREVSPGDIIVSYMRQEIRHIAVALSYCYDAPRPLEFGERGEAWSPSGWRIDAQYHGLAVPLRPKAHMAELSDMLPRKYSPLRPNGDGLQSVYLTELSEPFGELILDLVRVAGNDLSFVTVGQSIDASRRESIILSVEDEIQEAVQRAADQGDTEAEQIVRARRGQGRFRRNVELFEVGCRLSGVADREFLIASHIKPWRSASNSERLDGENGLLLTPNADWLFDRGFISFDDDGRVIFSTVTRQETLRLLGVSAERQVSLRSFTSGQKGFLAYHRENIFL